MGGEFAAPQDDPAGLVASLGYRKAGEWSVVGRSVELGALQMPRWLLNTVMRSLRDGYRVYRFEAAPH